MNKETKTESLHVANSRLNTRKPIRNVNVVHRERLSRLDRLALYITSKVGTMGFFLVIFVWTVFWLGWNVLAPQHWRFDPFPAFVLWLFLSNLIQIFLMPLLLVGQNLQGRHSEVRAEADFEVNTRAAEDISGILSFLESHDRMLKRMEGEIQQLGAGKK